MTNYADILIHKCIKLSRKPSRPKCAVTRGFQTTTQDLSVFPFLPRDYHAYDSYATITIHFACRA